mmetsp:Transcript_3144/g.6356  ORF Transcript_3144/g.6356 Transcript_3144/m.6356 type:complete len:351 (-) Transcript_3144:393-1445(-)
MRIPCDFLDFHVASWLLCSLLSLFFFLFFSVEGNAGFFNFIFFLLFFRYKSAISISSSIISCISVCNRETRSCNTLTLCFILRMPSNVSLFTFRSIASIFSIDISSYLSTSFVKMPTAVFNAASKATNSYGITCRLSRRHLDRYCTKGCSTVGIADTDVSFSSGTPSINTWFSQITIRMCPPTSRFNTMHVGRMNITVPIGTAIVGSTTIRSLYRTCKSTNKNSVDIRRHRALALSSIWTQVRGCARSASPPCPPVHSFRRKMECQFIHIFISSRGRVFFNFEFFNGRRWGCCGNRIDRAHCLLERVYITFVITRIRSTCLLLVSSEIASFYMSGVSQAMQFVELPNAGG